jgi:hypothetical protein
MEEPEITVCILCKANILNLSSLQHTHLMVSSQKPLLSKILFPFAGLAPWTDGDSLDYPWMLTLMTDPGQRPASRRLPFPLGAPDKWTLWQFDPMSKWSWEARFWLICLFSFFSEVRYEGCECVAPSRESSKHMTGLRVRPFEARKRF